MTTQSISLSPLPLVIQLGFAGARDLYDVTAHPQIDRATFEHEVAIQVADLLKNLPHTLGLPKDANVFFCGISQIAIGGDMVFAVACQKNRFLHRIFLPQPLTDYLGALGSKGPDFDAVQEARARTQLAQENVIQTRVVSVADNRHVRFSEVNLEIARVSDIVLCLVRGGQTGSAGGTIELAEMAARRGRPVIVLEVTVGAEGKPLVERTELPDLPPKPLKMPTLPNDVAGAVFPKRSAQPLPSGAEFCEALKSVGSDQANRLRSTFKWAAIIIVGGHVLATVLAVCALKLHYDFIAWLLGLELALLGFGLWVHHRMHGDHSIGRWAAFRLIAEVARSMKAIGAYPVYLEHFFSLPFPADFRPLLRTISVLHLHDTARVSTADWQTQRTRYVNERLRDPKKKAQIPYHVDTNAWATSRLALVRRVFYVGSISALAATTFKLLLMCHCLPVPHSWHDPLMSMFGSLAVLLPVIAVAALSLAAAFDLEAKEHTSAELAKILAAQAALLDNAQNPGEYNRLLIETETRMLGENVNWYSRRTFVGVA